MRTRKARLPDAGLALIAMKLLPWVPGHFQTFEFVALGVWVLLGLLLRRESSQP